MSNGHAFQFFTMRSTVDALGGVFFSMLVFFDILTQSQTQLFTHATSSF